MNNRIVPLGVALALTWIALPATGAAQDRPADRGEAAPAAGEAARPAQEQPKERPNADQAKQEQAKPERAATPPGRGNPANRDAVVGDMKDAEVRHRERLAMIGRLRALATEKGQTERLAALDKLEAKENTRFERHLQKVRGRMGDDEFNKVNERLARGRGHAKGRGADGAQPERGKPERPNAGQKPDRPGDDKDKDKADKERPAKEQAEKERAEKERAGKAKEKPKERAAEAKPERTGDKGGGQPRAGATVNRGQATGGRSGSGGGRAAGRSGGGKPRLERA